MNIIAISIITGVISGLVSSLMFFWMISFMRPKIELSTEICKGNDEHGVFYGFKVINRSIYHVLDLRAEVILKTPFNSNGGQNYSNKWIKLRRENILLFPRFKRDKNYADYALILATRDDLEDLWIDTNQFLEIKIHGKHSFSGVSKSFEQKFYTKKNCIKEGMFNFGKTFAIS